jgi:uncharacterized protein (DUF433 family)
MTETVRDLLRAFDALPPAEQSQVAAEVLRRHAPDDGLNRAATVAEGPAEALPLHADRPPLRVDEGGAVRVGNSRICLDLVVEQYENGMAPEDMIRAYDTLELADVHAVLAYYLRHKCEVRTYLKRQQEEAAALRAKIEAERPRVTREELLARRSAREKDRAPAGQ